MKKLISALCVVLVGGLYSCGGGSEDLSFQNPEWRATVNTDVTFPLPEQITLRVGLTGGAPDEQSSSIQWIENYTNIDLVFVTLGSSPGDVSLGEAIRNGNMPDIMPEGRLSLAEESIKELFVDFLEYPELTPNFYELVAKEPDFKASMLARTTPENELYGLGAYDPDGFMADGVIAYRRDLFERYNLKYDTWPQVVESLRFLKAEYPDSYPLGGSFESLLYHFPTWWGSGIDPDHVVYFDLDTRRWKFGLYEEEFLEAISVLAGLAQEGLLPPDIFSMKDADTRSQLANSKIFLAPYNGMTGPSFGHLGEGYGEVGDDGEWNGEGMWIEAMPLPKSPSGNSTRYSSRYLDPAGKGWQVYNQSEHVGEAIALVDLLLSDEAALINTLGTPGKAWEMTDDGPVLTEPFADAYKTGWIEGLRTAMSDAGLIVGSPLIGLEADMPELFGVPDIQRLKYYIEHDLQQNRPGIDIQFNPGIRFPEDYDFLNDRAMIIVTLQTEIESKTAGFIAGRRPFSDVTDMIENMRKYADDLLEMYNTLCIIPGDDRLFDGQ